MAITHVTSPGQTNPYFGKSSDTKPVENVPNASVFYEIDTGDVYMFDDETKTWLKQ